MSSTYLSLTTHIVFGTKRRTPWITPDIRPLLHAYIGGVIRGLDAVPIQIGGVEDHIHLLVGINSKHQIYKLVSVIKTSSTAWMHIEGVKDFAWQGGYGAFSESSEKIFALRNYISNQEAHHQTVSFSDELKEIFREAGIAWNA